MLDFLTFSYQAQLKTMNFLSVTKYINSFSFTKESLSSPQKKVLFKYRKYFGALRIFFGLVFFLFPVYEMIRNASESGPDFSRWGFILFFFLLYAVSAISNGIKEINEQMPGFHLLRFFEASLNGFIAIYLLILIFSLNLDFAAKFLFLLLNLVLIIAMVRDLRLISLQYYEKRKNNRE